MELPLQLTNDIGEENIVSWMWQEKNNYFIYGQWIETMSKRKQNAVLGDVIISMIGRAVQT
jgi:hypothetical protein